jgi:hypothetical protein
VELLDKELLDISVTTSELDETSSGALISIAVLLLESLLQAAQKTNAIHKTMFRQLIRIGISFSKFNNNFSPY